MVSQNTIACAFLFFRKYVLTGDFMKDGFIKVAAITPKLRVADVQYNIGEIKKWIKEAEKESAKIIVFPELCITGYSCQDLFLQDELLEGAKSALIDITKYTEDIDAMVFVGLPLAIDGKLYNVAAAMNRGKILGIVPKIHLPNYNEFYEARHFYSGKELSTVISIGDSEVPVGSRIIFTCDEMPALRIGAEICEDLWVPNPPSTEHCLVCAYIYASAGPNESTQDVVFSGHNIMSENGSIVAESELFSEGMIVSEFDMKYIEAERRRMATYSAKQTVAYKKISFNIKSEETSVSRYIAPRPFVPSAKTERNERCEEILTIQAMGLKKRLEHIGCKNVVIGISGGLDSTLAILVIVKAFDYLKLDHKGIVAVTMPGFGTTDRTYDNALSLIKKTGATLREINIGEAVKRHFADIDHDPENHDVTYENSQARERTQILMDIANQVNGIVIGTGDLSELALGWATYNGDHMSMYAVNASVPKTLVRHLVDYYADTCSDEKLSEVLRDILDTPVSPELLPPEDGKISQKTEDLVGPYELHDFFLYHMLRLVQSPAKIYRLAGIAFAGSYSSEEILKWEKVFYKRFFAQHFKRSCLPDGPKVGSVAVSPRGDLRMPSDACATLWLKELETLG